MIVSIDTGNDSITFITETNHVYKRIDVLADALHIIENKIADLKSPPVNVWHKKGDYELPNKCDIFFTNGMLYWCNIECSYTHFLIPQI